MKQIPGERPTEVLIITIMVVITMLKIMIMLVAMMMMVVMMTISQWWGAHSTQLGPWSTTSMQFSWIQGSAEFHVADMSTVATRGTWCNHTS